MAGMSGYGKFTHAVVRGIPDSFGKSKVTGGEGEEVDLAKAQRQYGVYTGILRQKLGLQLIEIPADSTLPDSWSVEDTAVIQGDTALITQPWNKDRRREIEAVRKVLEELKLHVVEGADDENATLDGSDVLFTGREFFVGISSWTNHKGAELVADTFRAMEQLTDHHYEILTVPDDAAANCVYVRVGSKSNYLLHRSMEDYPESAAAFQKLTDYTLLPTSCSETSKLGGVLSSCSLLINRRLDR
ncbi:UNVERIFIED_CONTAM: hypothetical protein FKN15_058928 [Acipenser sinensis]